MTTLLAIGFGIWIAKGLFDVLLGLGQILVGMICGIIAAVLLLAATIVEALETLWRTAFPPTTPSKE
jgi:hypothetical protein